MSKVILPEMVDRIVEDLKYPGLMKHNFESWMQFTLNKTSELVKDTLVRPAIEVAQGMRIHPEDELERQGLKEVVLKYGPKYHCCIYDPSHYNSTEKYDSFVEYCKEEWASELVHNLLEENYSSLTDERKGYGEIIKSVTISEKGFY